MPDNSSSDATPVKPAGRKRNHKAPRQALPARDPQERAQDHHEVALGFGLDQVEVEALRCLQCRDPKCNEACPIHTDIKAFIAELAAGDYDRAFEVIEQTNPFPGICGRVCQHELYCETSCLLDKKFESVAIGSLERFVADYHRQAGDRRPVTRPPGNGLRVGLIGSGPASLLCANDLARKGYQVTVFEALHELGGVLSYGIPPFRLPRDIIREEIDRLRQLGVEFHTNVIIGKTTTVDELFEQGYAALFVGTGAGLPHMMGIPGENLIGVYTANEFLTRLNLMHAYDFPACDTPVRIGARTVVIGGGNSAMDAARWAKRAGSESIIMFRRGKQELRAREEEVEHAEQEGVEFRFLSVPVRLIGDERGVLKEMECLRMELGPPDSSGRPSPVPIPGSEYIIPVDTVVMAIGQSPNPTLQQATPKLITKRGKIVADDLGQTSMDRVFAGGDVVRGGSTVILAMRDGRAAAQAIDQALREQNPDAFAKASAPSAASRFRIVERREITTGTISFIINAPNIARRWKPGQFVILRPRPDSERIPLTLVQGDQKTGTIRLIVQAIGKTTRVLAGMQEGEEISDLLGPLGRAAHIHKLGTVMCIGGGVGIAELLPVAKAFREAGNHVIAMCGARSTAQMILMEELANVADEVLWATDDGSYGFHGNVVQLMKDWKARTGQTPDAAHVIGPIPMMRFTSELTRDWKVPTMASLNPIMVDGTGMCGGCRVTVGGRTLFACVDGPEFDAHTVDFDELTRRNRAYVDHERAKLEAHDCLIGLGQ